MRTSTSIPGVFLIVGCFTLSTIPALAQPDESAFERLTTQDGLAGNLITGIVQDRQGFMWFATLGGGLSKYDGYEFTTYRHDPLDLTSLAEDRLDNLYIDSRGTLWVCTSAGLDRFDPVTETFTHFRHDPGDSTSLSNDRAFVMLEDHEGTLWVGTNFGGLNRFDRETETFTHFRHDPDDPTSLSDDNVRVLYEDRRGTLWVGTGTPYPGDEAPGSEGLNRFDRTTGTFTRYHNDPDDEHSLIDNRIGAIYEDSRGTFWIGTWGDGLHTMDRERGTFTRYSYDPDNPNRPHGPRLASSTDDDISITNVGIGVLFLHEDRTGALWIGGSGGLNRYDLTTGKLTHYEHGDFSRANTEWRIYESREGVLWIGTRNGLYRIPPEASPFERYQHDPDDPNSLSGNIVTTVFEDASSTLWVGTNNGGLNRFDRETETFTHYRHEADNPNSLSSDSVVVVYEAPSEPGVLWIGTDRRGLNRFEVETETFTHYRRDPDDPNIQSGDDADVIYVDVIYEAPSEPGVLWIGTLYGGLSRLDLATESFRTYTGLSIQVYRPELFNMLEVLDREGRSVAALLEVGNNEDRSYLFEVVEETPVLVVSLGEHSGRMRDYGWIEDEAGEVLWQMSAAKTRAAGGMGANRVQLAEMRLAPGSYRLRYRSNQWYSYGDNWYGLLPPDEPERWGIQVYSLQGRGALLTDEDETVVPPGTISSNWVTSILEDSAGTLWVGTGNGLDALDREAGTFTSYLPGSEINDIHEDHRGRFWLGTNDGLLLFDRNRAEQSLEDEGAGASLAVERFALEGRNVLGILEDEEGMLWIKSNGGLARYDPDAQTFTSFSAVGGIARGHVRSRRGELFFGGESGRLVHFYPGQVVNATPPAIALTGLRIFNDPVVPGPDSPLEAPVGLAESITLTHAQRDFTIDYAGLHYSNPLRNQYMYRMEGYDQDWVQARTQRSARYPGLPKGSYTFRVKAANSDGVWNEQGASIRVKIFPPWWHTPFAFVVYGLLLVAGLVTVERIHRKRLIRVERERARERELEKTREIEAMNRRLLEHERQLERQNEQLGAQKDQLETQARQLLELDSAKSRFFANISHEFRTPLTLILGPVESALRGAGSPLVAPVKELLRGIHDQAQRLLRLVNQLLDLARIESGKMTLNARQGDLAAYLRELVRSFAPMAEQKRITLQFHPESPTCLLVFDRDKVEKIFGNLLSNAIKFTPEGGKVRVTINNRSNVSDYVDITVKDTGPGIPQKALDRLFNRFEQLDAPATRRQEGTGIGLALAQELVELHGGEIRVESEEGFGSAFIVRLPADLPENLEKSERNIEKVQEAGGAAVELEQTILMPAAAETGSPAEAVPSEVYRTRILLVDDNEEVRAFVRSRLESTYDVIEAADGEEALALVRPHRPDLVLSDIMMPGMDGFELCRRLKGDEELRHIPVVLLTARAGESDTVQGLDCGADDYVVKPFSTEELLARLAGLIRSRRELRAQFSREVVLQPSGVVVQPEDEAFLERLLAIVEAHIDDSTFGVERLADEIGLSPRQLGRKLRALTKKTPVALIWEVRLARAAQLLEARSGTVAEVAYRTGFKSPSHFSTAFRRAYGVSPSAFAANRS